MTVYYPSGFNVGASVYLMVEFANVYFKDMDRELTTYTVDSILLRVNNIGTEEVHYSLVDGEGHRINKISDRGVIDKAKADNWLAEKHKKKTFIKGN